MSQWLEKTNKGRVVYDRPPHVFTQADVNRILRSVADGKDYTFLAQLLHSLDDYMLGIMLAPFGQADKAKLVREILEAFVGSVLRAAGIIRKVDITYTLFDESSYILRVT